MDEEAKSIQHFHTNLTVAREGGGRKEGGGGRGGGGEGGKEIEGGMEREREREFHGLN